MADDIDKANDCAQQFLDQALAAARRHEAGLIPSRWCYNCAAPMNDYRLFCDRDCRDDYERRVARSAK